MKKIFIALSVAFIALASCTKFVEDQPYVADSATAPKIATSDVKDSSFCFTVTAEKDNAYFSYAVIKGAAQALDSSDVLSVALKKNCVTVPEYDEDGVRTDVPVCGTLSYADSTYYTLKVTELVPNTKYTVYAVACSKKGAVTKLVTETILTTDGLTPHPLADKYGEIEVDDSDIDNGVLALKFNEPIVLSNDAKATVHYHAINAYEKDPALDCYVFNEILDEKVELPADSLEIDGNYLVLHVKPIPGAIITVTYPEAIVANGVGTKCPALEDQTAYWDGGLYFIGAGSRFETETFEFHNPYVADQTTGEPVRMPADTVIKFTDWTEHLMYMLADSLVTPEHNALVSGNDSWEENGVDFKLKSYSPASDKAVTYQVPDDAYGCVASALIFALGEEPERGNYISYSIAAGSFEDLWGNTNEAFTNFDLSDEDSPIYGNYFYSFGYKIEDLTGLYQASAFNAYTTNPYNLDFVIEESDNEDMGNVMFTNYMGKTGKLYADFDLDLGTLTIKQRVFNDSYNIPYFYGKTSIYFEVPQAGQFNNQSYYAGLGIYNPETQKVSELECEPSGAPMLYYGIDAIRN